MRARWAVTLVVVALLVPISAFAFDRPDDAKQKEPEEQVGSAISLPPASTIGIFTPTLTDNRQYRIEITGEWKPSAASGHFADAAWETTDSWANQTQQNTLGVVVGYLGNLGENPNAFYRSDHKYSVDMTGRGVQENIRVNDPFGYGDNQTTSNPLTIRIFALRKVHYVVTLSQQVALVVEHIPAQQIDSKDYYQSNPVATVPGTTISQTVPAVKVPAIGIVTIQYNQQGACGSGFRELRLIVTLFTPDDDDPDTDPEQVTAFNDRLVCGPPSIGLGSSQIPLPTLQVPIPVGPVQTSEIVVERSVCQPSGCNVFLPPEITQEVPALPPCQAHAFLGLFCDSEGDIAVLEDGSTVELLVGWHADTEKLWYTLFNDENFPIEEEPGRWQYVSPFAPGDTNWFVTEASAGRLQLDLLLSVYGPGKSPILQTVPVSIPGLGQILEAMFASTVNGQ